MSWRDRYRQASFRDVPFRVGSTEDETGRRTATHSFPGNDLSLVEDLGLRPRQFIVTGWVVGPDYDRDLAALQGALEQGGPGVLVHPYRGSLVVSVDGVRILQDSTEAGIARFSITFKETRNDELDASLADAAAEAAAAANAVQESAVGGFGAELVTEGPGFVLESASGQLTALSSALSRLNLVGQAEAVAGFFERAAALGDLVIEKLRDPFPLGREIVELLEDVQSGVASRLAAIEVYANGIFDQFEPRTFDGESLFAATNEINARALSSLIRAAALSSAVRAASLNVWETYDQAIAVRELLTSRLDALMEQAPDSVYADLQRLRAKLTASVPPVGEDLPRIQRVTPGRTVPSLVLAWQLYGDVEREAEIVERNGIRHPGFVPADAELEVLSG